MLTLNKIIEGFTEIEQRDVRVGRVDVPYSVFSEILKDTTLRETINIHGMGHAVPLNAPRRVGVLWGADVYLGGKDVVVKPEGWDDGTRWGCGVRDNLVRPFVVTEIGIREQWDIGNLTILVRTHCKPVGWPNAPEQMALETLRESLTEDEYRRYLKTGFLNVTGRSGRTYQIPRGSGYSPHVVVWERGKKVADICIYLKDDLTPPTDRVIAFKAIIEADEQELWQRGNVFKYQAE